MPDRSFSELFAALTADGPAPDPAQLCRRCAQAFGVDACSLAVLAGGRDVAATVTWGRLAEDVERLQEVLGEGPGWSARLQWRPQFVADVEDPGRFVAFSSSAGPAGLGSVYAFPVGVGAVRLAVLTLFDGRPGALQLDACREGVVAADVIAAVLLGSGDGGTGSLLVGQLVSQPSSVHRASGMVAAQLDCPVDEALVRMRARALADGVGVEEVANRVLARELRFVDGDGEPDGGT